MKNTKKTSAIADIPTPKNFCLFESIVSNEQLLEKESEINKYVQRVGFVLKVLSGRNLTALQLQFQDELTTLIKSYCTKIDDELYPTKEN